MFYLWAFRVVGRSPQMWRKFPEFRAEKIAQNPVTSLAVILRRGIGVGVEGVAGRDAIAAQ